MASRFPTPGGLGVDFCQPDFCQPMPRTVFRIDPHHGNTVLLGQRAPSPWGRPALRDHLGSHPAQLLHQRNAGQLDARPFEHEIGGGRRPAIANGGGPKFGSRRRSSRRPSLDIRACHEPVERPSRTAFAQWSKARKRTSSGWNVITPGAPADKARTLWLTTATRMAARARRNDPVPTIIAVGAHRAFLSRLSINPEI
jgi:hypothetical protein